MYVKRLTVCVCVCVKRLNESGLWLGAKCPARQKTAPDPTSYTYTRVVATRKPCPSQWGQGSGGADPEYLWLVQTQYTISESHMTRVSSKPTIRLLFGTHPQDPCSVKRQAIPELLTGARPRVDSDTTPVLRSSKLLVF